MQLDEPLRVYHHPANRFVAGFIGSPAMNFLSGTIHSPEGAAGEAFSFVHEGGVLRISLGASIPDALKAYGGKRVLLGLRPEHILICEGAEEGAAPPGLGREPDCMAVVVACENMGNEQLVYLTLVGQELILRRPPTERMEAGAEKGLKFLTDKIVWLDGVSGERLC